MNPDNKIPLWRIQVVERDYSGSVFVPKSFDDEYLDELKTLRDPSFKPDTSISLQTYLDSNCLNAIKDALYADL